MCGRVVNVGERAVIKDALNLLMKTATVVIDDRLIADASAELAALRAQLDAALAALSSGMCSEHQTPDPLNCDVCNAVKWLKKADEHRMVQMAQLRAELEALNQEQEGPVDQFIDQLFSELNRHGIDTSCWDGDEPPHVIIADRLRAELAEARGLAGKLVERMVAIHDSAEYASVWQIAQLHGGYYKGLTYEKEFAALREWLDRPAAIAAARRGE